MVIRLPTPLTMASILPISPTWITSSALSSFGQTIQFASPSFRNAFPKFPKPSSVSSLSFCRFSFMLTNTKVLIVSIPSLIYPDVSFSLARQLGTKFRYRFANMFSSTLLQFRNLSSPKSPMTGVCLPTLAFLAFSAINACLSPS